jgi:hypothetical protein
MFVSLILLHLKSIWLLHGKQTARGTKVKEAWVKRPWWLSRQVMEAKN